MKLDGNIFAVKLQKYAYNVAVNYQHAKDTYGIGSSEEQRLNQYLIAISDVAFRMHNIYLDLPYVIDCAHNHQPFPNNLETVDDNVDYNLIVNNLRQFYFEYLRAKKEYEYTIGKTNPNYDYRINALIEIFKLFNLDNYYQDIEHDMRKLVYKLELNDVGQSFYIELDPKTGKKVKKPYKIKQIKLKKRDLHMDLVQFWIDKQDKQRLIEKSKKHGMNLSQYIRFVLLDAL